MNIFRKLRMRSTKKSTKRSTRVRRSTKRSTKRSTRVRRSARRSSRRSTKRSTRVRRSSRRVSRTSSKSRKGSRGRVLRRRESRTKNRVVLRRSIQNVLRSIQKNKPKLPPRPVIYPSNKKGKKELVNYFNKNGDKSVWLGDDGEIEFKI